MARHNLGKKINENGTLEDLGNTISDEDLDYIDHTSNYLEWTKSRTISGTYTTIELFNVAPKSVSSKYFVSAEVTTNDGYDFTLIVYDGVAKITKDVDGKLYSKEDINSMFSYPPQLGVYFGYDYVRAMFKTTGAWVKVKVSAIGCWEDDRSYVNIETLYSGIQAGYTLPTWTRVANESDLVISASLKNLISKSGGTITGNLEVNGNLTKNGVNVVTENDIDGFVASEEAIGSEIEPTILDNYYTKTQSNNTFSNKNLSNVTYPIPTAGSTTTGAGDRVIETYVSSDRLTWYRKWASGWKECGMRPLVYSTGTTVTLPISMSSSTYTIVGTPQGNKYVYSTDQSKTASSFQAKVNTSDEYVYFYVCGY